MSEYLRYLAEEEKTSVKFDDHYLVFYFTLLLILKFSGDFQVLDDFRF